MNFGSTVRISATQNAFRLHIMNFGHTICKSGAPYVFRPNSIHFGHTVYASRVHHTYFGQAVFISAAQNEFRPHSMHFGRTAYASRVHHTYFGQTVCKSKSLSAPMLKGSYHQLFQTISLKECSNGVMKIINIPYPIQTKIIHLIIINIPYPIQTKKIHLIAVLTPFHVFQWTSIDIQMSGPKSQFPVVNKSRIYRHHQHDILPIQSFQK